jgi:exosome complex RNA-binding protein Csl4
MGVLPNTADERVGVIGATCKEGEGEMINELGDGDDMESSLELWDGCSLRKVSNDS